VIGTRAAPPGRSCSASTLARRFNLPTTFVGVPQAPLASTLWDEQLSAARGDLHAFADALHAQMGRGIRCITAMGRCAGRARPRFPWSSAIIRTPA
jgi:hypothetical protein